MQYTINQAAGLKVWPEKFIYSNNTKIKVLLFEKEYQAILIVFVIATIVITFVIALYSMIVTFNISIRTM